jgi:two-component system cell cycle sensor histidine kinase PleC
MPNDQFPPGLDGLPTPSAGTSEPDRASISVTRAVALTAAAILGAAIIVGGPVLFRQQQRLGVVLSDSSQAVATGDPGLSGMALSHLAQSYWITLAIVAGAGIALAYCVLRMLRHAQSQVAVRKESQSMLLRAERARLDADQANADKSRFLAEAGHDLRTPLTTILGYGEIIERELMGPIGRTVYRDAAENIVLAGRQLTARIADIIELSRVDGAIARPADHASLVSAIVRDAHGWAVSSFAAKRLTIGLRLPDSPVGLKVQPLLLRRIARGVITDAAARTPEGGAVIISVGFGGDGRLDLSVRDTGPGPSLAAGGPSRSTPDRRSILLARRDGGGELGLMIVRALMESIGGHMEVVDTGNRGSEIHLLFPRHLVVRSERHLRRQQLTE